MKATLSFPIIAAMATTLVAAFAALPASAKADGSGTMQWSVKGPSSLAIEPGGAIPISVSVENATPATNVKLIKVLLVEQTTKHLLDQGELRLCIDTATSCNGLIGDLAQGPHNLWLVSSDKTQPGRYGGSITIASKEKPNGDDVGMTVFVSTGWAKALGIIIIAASVIAAWLVTVVLRNALNRLQLLVPARQILDALGPAVADLAEVERMLARSNVAIKLSTTHTKVDDVSTALGTEKLKANGLPPWFPIAYAVTGTPSVSDYRTYIQTQSSWVADIKIIVDGLKAALVLFKSTPPVTKDGLVEALQQIDKLLVGSTPSKPEQLTSAVDGALDTLGKTRPKGLVALSQAPTVQPPSTSQLEVEISVLNIVAWGFVAVATTVAGTAVMIYSSDKSPAFGITQDYLYCIIWGLGLPTGAGLLGTTTSSLTTAFNITKP